MTLTGFASREGTAEFIERFPAIVEKCGYRRFQRKHVSTLGIGTYLGDPSVAIDQLYSQSITQAISMGCNVIDTAINYRHMGSERIVGQTLQRLCAQGNIKREYLLLCTKGGYIPYDARSGISWEKYYQETFVENGILPVSEPLLSHSLEPQFIEHQLEVSLQNLGVSTIDIYYLHNPEVALATLTPNEFYNKLEASFAVLEKAVTNQKINCYGMATWNGFLAHPTEREYLSLCEIMKIAQNVGGTNHHFAALQLPLNLTKCEALSLKNQKLSPKGGSVSVLTAALENDLDIFASASLAQGALTRFLPPTVREVFPNLQSDVQRALQFSRSCPGVCTALVGMKQAIHVKEGLSLLQISPTPAENFVRFFECPGGV